MNEEQQKLKDLVTEALVNNNKEAQANLQNIIKTAKAQRDKKSLEIISLIQKFVQEIQNNASQSKSQIPSNKQGAKLAYVMSLRNKCPEGYTKTLSKGGCICQKKAEEGTKFERSKDKMFIKKK